MRVGAMFYYRTNRDQLGVRNQAQPTSAYTAFNYTAPNSPGGTVANPKPATVTIYNIDRTLVSAINNVRDNQDYLDTEYKGVEFTAAKRFTEQLADGRRPDHRQEQRRRQRGAGPGASDSRAPTT